ncbi:MAG: NADH-quinone oxidoreductase subunit L [Methanosarcinales archaeon]|nr:NADH-quinone oxidoreductase subunit L [Methanosarcinales archaeon]
MMDPNLTTIDFGLYAHWIVLLPMIGFLLELLIGKYTWRKGGMFATLSIFGSMIISYGCLYNIYVQGMPFYEYSWPWFYDGIVAGFTIDPLSLAMLCMVSFVSFFIHIYAIGYMAHDCAKSVYFAETALFTGSMFGLVLANNLLQLFIFWEMVGVCSYLLIGFWWHKPEAAAAGKKAWMSCSVGDCLFLLGIAIMYTIMVKQGITSEIISFNNIFQNLEHLSHETLFGMSALTLICILFMCGVLGKSAGFPLHVWIPDAMEGPTTVSALIHAATMVTAGVYLIARAFPIFLAAPNALMIVAFMGAFTALYASTLGLVVNDLKRIFAYSTISQLGYMIAILGCGAVLGVAAVAYALLHLVAHAFFKALLFLSSGSVLHGTSNTRDIKEMGGLLKGMPWTGYAMLAGALALIAFPFTAGYYSKDRIIEEAYLYAAVHHPGTLGYLPWVFLVLGVILTATYTFRAWYLAMTGDPKSHLAVHPHECDWWMRTTLIVLSFFAIFLGIITGGGTKFWNFLEKTFVTETQTATGAYPGLDIHEIAHFGGNTLLEHGVHHHIPAAVIYLPLFLMIAGLGIATAVYYKNRVDVSKYIKKDNPLYQILWNKYYLDYLFKDIIAEKIIMTVFTFWDVLDRYVIDGVVNLLSWITIQSGQVSRKLQTGVVQNYATAVIFGVSLLMILVMMIKGGM